MRPPSGSQLPLSVQCQQPRREGLERFQKAVAARIHRGAAAPLRTVISSEPAPAGEPSESEIACPATAGQPAGCERSEQQSRDLTLLVSPSQLSFFHKIVRLTCPDFVSD